MARWKIFACLMLWAPGAHAANLIQNAGFEFPLAPAATYVTFAVGQTPAPIARWTIVGGVGNVAIVDKAYVNSGFTVTPRSGNQCIDLTGTTNSPTGVQQIVPTVIGTTYQLTYWVGNIYHIGGSLGTSGTVDVFVNGERISTVMNTGGNGQITPSWRRFTVKFVATTASTAIAFINRDPAGDNANLLDDVSLVIAP